ncbi:SPOR domain-containing protein [Silanimonas lenta]|uniref:SPOR domain-containing protein n=1 Tax=Silanimonas lenta TaxID=265429 RepID=UPI002FE26FF6
MAARRGRSQARRGGGGIRTALVLLAGLAIGLALAAGYLMFGDRKKLDALLPQPNPAAEAPRVARDRQPVAQEPEAPARPAKPTYDFYTVLPQKEVELPGQSAQAARPAATPAAPGAEAGAAPDGTSPATPTPTAGRQLQAGAFSNAADAEALRARLALLGQSAHIESVQAEGRTLHRVRLGPFADEAALENARRQLAEAGISATPAR